ncbi:hypothetical protein KKC67_01585 [Patescibacteria group bacterium]|nr:hypothetical protein [Patescibacteria group bacterium]MBU0879453.1 hypothetical protein [Patescibacteria group bacterium]MBU0879960.1 hypothetical protein [Patescibacteria group bacterium]MBU1991689.1 hypothetical protein [Patescibacteria group bacterium]MBU2081104.1 hypothetical protein [Patescibacteria group bacterium]
MTVPINIKLAALTKQKQSSYKPPTDHPWRKQFLYGKMLNQQKILTQK